LSLPAKAVIARPDTVVFVSAASAMEIATKATFGQLEAPEASRRLAAAIGAQGFRALGIDFGHALRAGGLPQLTHDVFDRMLTAQALTENLSIVSDHPIFSQLGVDRIW
jgi:PIN domain nuclease of toxin-antitoxin system